MPVFNGERYIEEAIDSILGQTLSDFELIISDNASTDRTPQISQAYAARDTRVRYVRNAQNLGAAENYNRVFRASAGRYFKWAAHDDLCAPEFLERCVNVLEKDASVVLCYPKSVFIDENGNPITEYVEDVAYTDARPHKRLRTWLMERPGGWCNLVFGVIRSSVLGKTGLIGKYNSSDYVLVGELALWGRLHRVPECLFLRRDHSGRSTLAHPEHEAIAVWFDSSAKKGRIYLPRWRWLVEYLKAIHRAPLSAIDKLYAGGVTLRWMIRARHQFWRDLRGAAGALAERPYSRPKTAKR